MTKISITGHRNLVDPEEVRKILTDKLTGFKKKYPNLIVVSQIASGADTLFAQAALTLNIPLQVILPFQKERYSEDFMDGEPIIFEQLLELATAGVSINGALNSNAPDARKEAYLAAGKAIVDQSDVIIAVWNRKRAAGKGGTADIIDYAKQQNKKLVVIDAYRDAQDCFECFDLKAKSLKKKFEWAWILGVIFGILGVFCFGVKIAFREWLENESMNNTRFYISLTEIAFIAISALMLGYLTNNLKIKFLSFRRSAEYLRTLMKYENSDIYIPTVKVEGYELPQEIISIEQKFRSKSRQASDIVKNKALTIDLAKEQKTYHAKRVKRLEKRNYILEMTSLTIRCAFGIAVVCSLFFEVYEHSQTPDVFIKEALSTVFFIWIILPPLYAAYEGVKYFTEWKKNIDVSQGMEKKLNDIIKDLSQSNDADTFAPAAKQLREIIEAENGDWAQRLFEKKFEGFKPA